MTTKPFRPFFRHTLNVSVMLTLATGVWLTSASISYAAFPGGNGKIAFVVDSQIYVTDGTNVTQCTFPPHHSNYPRWSSDGSKIVFASDRDGPINIYMMNADCSNQMRLTTTGDDSNPSWSPDGAKIAFHRTQGSQTQIYVMNANGTAQTRCTNNTTNDYVPVWSPDGTKIVFYSDRAGGFNLYVIAATACNGTTDALATPLTTAGGAEADWSPDGSEIVFQRSAQIYVMNADGTAQTRCTNLASNDLPAWSPDGTKLLFRSNRSGQPFLLYVMDIATTSCNGITEPPVTPLTIPSLGVLEFDWQSLPSDTTPPAITITAPSLVQATMPLGAPVVYLVSAVDAINGPVPVACTPASGQIFLFGKTTIHCTATDASGNKADAFFDVFVVDTSPPEVLVPPDFTVPATSPAGAVVEYEVDAFDSADGALVPNCIPMSGEIFPIGVTEVLCMATDAHGNSGFGAFHVLVEGPEGQLSDLLSFVTSQARVAGESLQAKLKNALAALRAGDLNSACGKIGAFINEVQAQSGKKTLMATQAELLIRKAIQIGNTIISPSRPLGVCIAVRG